MEIQYGDQPPVPFSYLHKTVPYAVREKSVIMINIEIIVLTSMEV